MSKWQNRIIGTGEADPKQLTANPVNFRKHPKRQQDAINGSLDALGWIQNVIVNQRTGRIIDGHLRVEQAIAHGEAAVPVQWVDLSEEEERQALLSLDPIAAMAETDKAMMTDIMKQIADTQEMLAPYLEEIGKSSGIDIGDIFGKDEEDPPDESQAETFREKWGVQSGQLWELGDHRVVCGDCTDIVIVNKVFEYDKSEICFTSPPYSNLRSYDGGDMSIEKLKKFLCGASTFCKYIVVNFGLVKKDDELLLYWDEYINFARKLKLKLISWNVWDKGRATSIGTQSAMFAIEHEFIFVFGTKSKKLNRTIEKSDESDKRLRYAKKDNKGRLIRSVRESDGTFSNSTIGNNFRYKNLPSIIQCFPQMARDITVNHPAPFPIQLPESYIEAMTDKSDIVYEPFLGSGTTLIACENLHRKCRGIDISPQYVAVTIERWHRLTGKTPRRLS